MNDSEFHERVNAILAGLEEAIDASSADLDYETVSDILTLEFEDGSKIIVNKQIANHQIWVAARSGGFHYRYDADHDCWLEERKGTELFGDLSRLAGEQAGATVDLIRG